MKIRMGANSTLGDEVKKVAAAVGQVLDEAAGAIDRAISDLGRRVRRRGPSEGPADQATVVFEVHAPTAWGESVWVVGDVPELGQWEPALGVLLAPTDYPTWSARVVLPPFATVQYKYLRKNPDGSYAWEVSNGNRALVVPQAGDELHQSDDLSWP